MIRDTLPFLDGDFATSATKTIDNVEYDRKAPLDKHNRLSPYK